MVKTKIGQGPLLNNLIFDNRTVLPFPKVHTVALIDSANWKKGIFLHTMKVGADDRSAQEFQNEL